ncbi:MAG: lysylphosphatidylglycerol synthase transmembrane domain-containing protein [Candidatus Omnitrophota bacterium]
MNFFKENNRGQLNKVFFFILKIAVSLGIVFALFKYIPYSKLIALFVESNKLYIALSFLVFFLSYVLGVMRWQFILNAMSIAASFREVFCVSFAGYFFNLFFPSIIAGDAFKSLAITSRYKQGFKTVSSVVMDRFSGLVALCLIVLVAYPLGGYLVGEKDILLAVLIFSAVTIGSIFILLNEAFFRFIEKYLGRSSFGKKIKNLYEEFFFFRKNIGVFIKSIIYSIFIQVGSCLIFYLLARAFHVNPPLKYFFILIPFIQFIGTIPLTIAGMGTRDAATIYFLAKIGVPGSVAMSVSLIVLSFIVFSGIAGGVIYALVYHRWLESSS